MLKLAVNENKCIGDDTKAAARQNLNCIKNKKIWRKTIFNMADGILTPSNLARTCGILTVNSSSGSTMQCDTWLWDNMPLNSSAATPCNVTRSSGIMALNSPGGSTLQCGRWLWDDMPLNAPKRPPYWNSTRGSDFDHITAVDMSSASVSDILSKSDHPRQKKMTSCRFSRWRIAAILYFKDPIMGSLKSPCTTSYRS